MERRPKIRSLPWNNSWNFSPSYIGMLHYWYVRNITGWWFGTFFVFSEQLAKLGILHYWLVVWNKNFMFSYIGNVIIPTDELHHFSEGLVYHQPDMDSPLPPRYSAMRLGSTPSVPSSSLPAPRPRADGGTLQRAVDRGSWTWCGWWMDIWWEFSCGKILDTNNWKNVGWIWEHIVKKGKIFGKIQIY